MDRVLKGWFSLERSDSDPDPDIDSDVLGEGLEIFIICV